MNWEEGETKKEKLDTRGVKGVEVVTQEKKTEEKRHNMNKRRTDTK